ncbi:MAG: helix-turn-helix domain-containing protein [Acidobacteriota bacterium]|nr:helix-turn-helix domain-containing protein [Acidobacteriota bacterium]
MIEIPPLRRRREDIPELAERFLREICREYAREELRLSPSALEAMLAYSWPGNVRELKRALERVVLLAEGPSFTAADLPRGVTGASGEGEGVEATLRRFERNWLRRHLAEADGDLGRTAARLGISREELEGRLQQLGIQAQRGEEPPS